MEVMRPYEPEVIPEVEGVQAFPPAHIKTKGKKDA